MGLGPWGLRFGVVGLTLQGCRARAWDLEGPLEAQGQRYEQALRAQKVFTSSSTKLVAPQVSAVHTTLNPKL